MRRHLLVALTAAVLLIPLTGRVMAAAPGEAELFSTSTPPAKAIFSTSSSLSADGSKVVFESDGANLSPADGDGTIDLFAKDVGSGQLTLLSMTAAGDKGNGRSMQPSLSGDGRLVAFVSEASNLVAADPDSRADIYVKDLQTGTIALVSASSTGVKANRASDTPEISADGTTVAFMSEADNLDPADVDNDADIYVKDLVSGQVRLASSTDAGAAGNGPNTIPTISGDGTLVAFQSRASDLDLGDTDADADIYLKDLATGDLRLVSTNALGVKANQQTLSPDLSTDGSRIAFNSNGSNMDPADPDELPDVYVKDIASGALTLASVTAAGVKGDRSAQWPSLSSDGMIVAFETHALNLDPRDAGGSASSDIYVKNLFSGSLSLATTSDAGDKGDGESFAPDLSQTGQRVSFISIATGLDPLDPDTLVDVYVKDLVSDDITLASISGPERKADGPSEHAAISPDGAVIAFDSTAANLDPRDTDALLDVYVKQLSSGRTLLVSMSWDGHKANGPSALPTLSSGGQVVAFASNATNLDPADTDALGDIFVREPVAHNTLQLVSTSSTGQKGNGASNRPSLSADGLSVAFYSTATNLHSDDGDASFDIFVKDRRNGELRLASASTAGVKGIGNSLDPSLSRDGTKVAFESEAQMDPADTDTLRDVYVKDLVTGGLVLASTSSTGVKGTAHSMSASISGDGTAVAFFTLAQLDPADTDAFYDVYVKDLVTGATLLASRSAAGADITGDSNAPGLSADGDRVSFSSNAPDLHPADADAFYDIFVKDLVTGEVTLASVGAGGKGNEHSVEPRLAGDGLAVVFVSNANNLDPLDPDPSSDIYLTRIQPSIPDSEPGAPMGVVATGADQQATVAWSTPADDGGSPITGYVVTSSPGNLTATVGGATTTANVTGLTNGTSYTFTVTATNAIGTGPASLPSNAVTPIAKANQTITFGAPANRTMLQSPVTVSASASSGLPVFFSTTTPAVCTSSGANGQTITLVGAGTCTVRADQPGNAFFNPAPSLTRSFTVSRVNQTITFGVVANKTLAQTPFTVSATASSGLTVTFASTTPTVCTNSGTNGTKVDLLSPGSCTIVASQPGNATYYAALDRPRTFTVTFAGQTITFPNITTKTMVQSPVTATATASSGLPVTFTTSTPAVCTAGGTNGWTITLVAPGSCTVLADQAGNGTYAPATQRSRTFTVNRTAQTITFANPGSKTLAQSPLTVNATASSGLPVAFTAMTPAVCNSSGTAGSTITFLTTGACSVVAAQPGNANYAPATSITRTFTVSRAPQTITFGALPTANLLQSPLTASATASSGLTVTFTTSSASVCTASGVNGTTITLLKAGTCRVVASQAGNATYRPAANVTRSFAVTTAKLAQTITFAALGSRSIGAPPLTLAATASSGLAVSYLVAPASAAICSVAGSVLTLHDPGTCTITASQAGNASFLAAPPVTQALTATLEGFVQASGASLVLDGQPFEIFGANIYQTSNFGHTADPDQVFGWAADARLNTLRLTDIFNQTTNDPTAPYREADWQWIDGLIARARDQGMKVVLDFSSYRNWLVWSSQIDNGWLVNCQPNQDRTPVDYTLLDPYTVAHRADWTTFMTFVANRVNTVTGIIYRNDPTILVVSIAGEPVGPGWGECGKASSEQELTDFFAWALAEWKSLDPYHLRSTGGLHGTYAGLDGNGDPIPSGQLVDGIALFGLADNTLPSLHTYPPQTMSLPLADGQTPVLAPVAQALGKPWFTEEFGFRQEETDPFRASEFDAIYDAQIAYGSAGSLFWNLGPEIGVGTFDVNPSTPLTWARILAEAP